MHVHTDLLREPQVHEVPAGADLDGLKAKHNII